jgi:hypothetical protein
LRRNCLIKHIIEGKILGTRRRGRRRMQLLDDLKETRRYWNLKEEAQDRTLLRTQFGRGYRPVARQTNTWSWSYVNIVITGGAAVQYARVKRNEHFIWENGLSWLFVVYSTTLSVYGLSRIRRGRTSANISGVLAEIRTEYPSNIGQERHRYVNPLYVC